MVESSTIRVEVVCAWPDRVWHRRLTLPAGSTVDAALAASRWMEDLQPELGDAPKAGVYGRLVPPGHVLRDGDRVELYRPLLADPRDARRKRAAGEQR